VPSPLDSFLPVYDAREHFQLLVRAPAGRTFDVAAAFDLRSPFLVRAIFRLREKLLGSRVTDQTPSHGFLEDMQALGWGVLAHDPGRLFIAGAHCQPWRADVRFVALSPTTFGNYQEPGQVKIAWTLETVPMTGATCFLRTETRACATDPVTRRRFRSYWRWARFGILPIRWLMLPAIRRQVESA